MSRPIQEIKDELEKMADRIGQIDHELLKKCSAQRLTASSKSLDTHESEELNVRWGLLKASEEVLRAAADSIE